MSLNENYDDNGKMRLQKYLAMCGVASRRKSEELIKSGRIKVNGAVVREMGTEVADGDRVQFDGKPVRPEKRKRYIMLNKPAGVVTTTDDPEGRQTALSLIEDISERIYPVGRLDFDTEGLLLFTNDGELANRLTHPRYKIEKQYLATVKGTVHARDLKKIESGITLPDGFKAQPAKLRVVFSGDNKTAVEVTVREGHNRIIRQMFEAIDKQVIALKREKIGNVSMVGLTPGRWRHLSGGEIEYLRKVTKLDE